MANKQHGMSLLGFLIILVLILFFAYIGMKLGPIYMNHYSVVSSMKSLSEEPGAANMSEARLRQLLRRKFDLSYVKHIEPADIEVIRSSGTQILAEYEVRETLIGNVDAVVSFRRVQQLN